MSALAELEIALRRDRAFARLAETHAHRATREDSMGVIKGREAILEAWIAEEPATVAITDDFDDMVAYEVGEGATRWRGQRWVMREDGRILHEIVVETRPRRIAPPLVHPPLGELRSGRGQFDAGLVAVTPPGFPEAARPTADRLHRAWNARAFDLGVEEPLVEIIRLLPDATFVFERAVVRNNDVALLWRVHGHRDGRRIRLIGGSVARESAPVYSVIDKAALEAQSAARCIDYGATSL